MKVFSRMVITFLMLFVTFGIAISLADTNRPVGWVDSFNGIPKDYKLVRGGNSMPVEFFMPLFAGDKIQVLQKVVHIKISTGENESQLIKMEDGIFTVKSSDEPPTIAGNMMSWAGQWFTGIVSGKSTKSTVSLVTRAGMSHMTSPLLMNIENWIEEGKKDFYFSWKGGVAPYKVTIQLDNKIIYQRDKIEENSLYIDSIVFNVGFHELMVEDSKGYLYEGYFDVKPLGTIPKPPVELTNSNLPAQLKSTIYASWLSSLDDGAWTLTTYQLIAPLAENYEPAMLMLKAMDDGRYIDAIPEKKPQP